jgi:hypothetical protein
MWVAACLMIRVNYYDISVAVSFTLPNHVDDTLKQCYPKSHNALSPVQLCTTRARAGGHPLRWIEHALNNAPELASFMTPFPDDPPWIHTYKHSRIRTVLQFALHGAGWIPERIGQGASPISRDSFAEGIACAAEHPDGIAPERFRHSIFDLALSVFGRHEKRELAIGLGMLDW